MALPFARSIRSLDRDGHSRPVVLTLVGAALLAAWATWAVVGRVRLYETATQARLETLEPLHRVEAPTSARVVDVLVALGDPVRTGQALVQLDATAERLALAEAEARAEGLRAQLEPLEAALGVARQHAAQSEATVQSVVSEAEARERAVRTAAELARDRSDRMERLAVGGAISEIQRVEARAEATRSVTDAEAAGYGVRRARWEQLTRHTDSRARVEGLRRELVQLEGEIASTDAAVARLREELERRVVRAPCAGHVAAIETLSAGRVVDEGAPLVSILPEGPLRVVAYFAPRHAFGRLRPGQPAQLRLDAFPWTQFGSLAARVDRVAEETRDEGVRVELTLLDPQSFAAPLEHGQPGSLEVEVEEVSPAELVLRMAGGWTETRVARADR